MFAISGDAVGLDIDNGTPPEVIDRALVLTWARNSHTMQRDAGSGAIKSGLAGHFAIATAKVHKRRRFFSPREVRYLADDYQMVAGRIGGYLLTVKACKGFCESRRLISNPGKVLLFKCMFSGPREPG